MKGLFEGFSLKNGKSYKLLSSITEMIKTSAASHMMLKVLLNCTSKPNLKPVISNLKTFWGPSKKTKKSWKFLRLCKAAIANFCKAKIFIFILRTLEFSQKLKFGHIHFFCILISRTWKFWKKWSKFWKIRIIFRLIFWLFKK
jgi:hypothetical protein